MTFRRHGERALRNPWIVDTLESLLLIDFNYLRVRRGRLAPPFARCSAGRTFAVL